MAIVKLAKGKYQVKVLLPGRKWKTKVFHGLREARQWEVEVKNKPLTHAGPTLIEFFNQWQIIKQGTVSAGWQRNQRAMFDLYIRPTLGALPMGSIRPEHIAATISSVALKGRSPATCRHVYVLLRHMFRDGEDWVAKSPVLRSLAPRLISKEATWLDPECLQKLLGASEGHPLEAAIWLCSILGLRAGEVQGLKWEDVDFSRGVVHIRRVFCKAENRLRDYPKGRKHHSKPIPPDLLSNLQRWMEKRHSDFVAAPPHTQQLTYKYLREKVRELCKAAGVKVVSPHALRHSCSELWLRAGASRDDVQDLLAHSSISTTQRYLHGRNSRLPHIAKALSFQNVSMAERSSKDEKTLTL